MSLKAAISTANVAHLQKAIVVVFHELARAEVVPGSEKWPQDRLRGFPILREAIYQKWLELSRYKGKEHKVIFPWSDDFVIRCWVSFRKESKEKKNQWCQYYQLDTLDNWEQGSQEDLE